MVINKQTDVEMCIQEALNQEFNGQPLKDLYEKLSIKRSIIYLNQPPINNQNNSKLETDVSSCDRPELLECMLEGSYTQSDTNFGKNNTDCSYIFNPNITIQYDLTIEDEHFCITHNCAFINESMTRVIPLQENSALNIEEIFNNYSPSSNPVLKKRM